MDKASNKPFYVDLSLVYGIGERDFSSDYEGPGQLQHDYGEANPVKTICNPGG
jgi:hypothetical protein